MKTTQPINNNIVFYLLGFAGIFMLLVFLRLAFNLVITDKLNFYASIIFFLTVIVGITLPAYLALTKPRLYIIDENLIVKKSFKIHKQILLTEIRVIKKISAFPYGFAYSNMICRYQVDFLDDHSQWQSISFFDTLSDQKNIQQFIETVKQENPFLKSSI